MPLGMESGSSVFIDYMHTLRLVDLGFSPVSGS